MALAPAIRQTVWNIDSDAQIMRIFTLENLVRDSAWRLNYSTMLLSGLAALSLLLAVVGVYGVLSHVVRERTREIGLRMALGAGRAAMFSLVLKQALGTVSLGIVAGLAAATGLTRFLGSLLFGVEPIDPLTFVGVPLLLVVAACLASYFPAHRATKVDPMVALRHE